MYVKIGKYNKKGERKVIVKIDKEDTWAAYITLAHIIHPLLIELKKTKHGVPFTDDEDVPEGQNLRSTEAPPIKHTWDADDNFFKRWEWIIDEMIWAFNQILKDDVYHDVESKEDYERVTNGLKLFGKYYFCLWD